MTDRCSSFDRDYGDCGRCSWCLSKQSADETISMSTRLDRMESLLDELAAFVGMKRP